MKKNILLTVVLMTLLISRSWSQKDVLFSKITVENNSQLISQKNYLDYLSSKYDIVFSYNANLLKDDKIVKLTTMSGTMAALLHEIFSDHQLVILTQAPNKIILHSKGVKKTIPTFILSGHVYDKNSHEQISGAIIFERHSNTSVISNENGYYIIEIPSGAANLEIRYLGYMNQQHDLQLSQETTFDVFLDDSNELPTIVINGDDPKSRINLGNSGDIMDVFKTKEFKSIVGDRDIINNAKILSGVQSGGEGQSGIYVRGGSPDQNLIQLEGVALYETSHIAGISSIFVEESIKEASFIKSGFPARYSGRISSVMDIQLKDGDQTKAKRTITMGLPGAKIHLDGPVFGSKTTYNVSARTSWLNFYVDKTLRKFTKYNNININYNDFLGKITHHFTPSNSISFTVYSGSDRLGLTKIDTIQSNDYTLNIFDRNALNWGNKMASLKWNRLIGDKLSIKFQSGILSYNNGSRSSYKFDTILSDTTKTDELDVISASNILDKNARLDLEYYYNDKHVFKLGANLISHAFNPTVKQSLVILEGEEANITDRDSTINASEMSFYVEDNFKIGSSFFLYAGINATFFRIGSTTHPSYQPRLKAIWSPVEKHLFIGAYSRMGQFVHLLSNTGLGLPSDLWVPSTENIKPQYSDQYSLQYTYNILPSTYFTLGGYTKTFANALEYTSPIELFYFLINNQNIVPVYNNTKDWERNLYFGKGTSKGVEWLIHKKEGNTKAWFSTTYSKTDRTFGDINNGLPFPASYDRTWDINTGISQKITGSFSVGANFVYGTGNTFSLATEEFDSFLGIKLLKSDGRNNYRLPPFHHLSLNANYTHTGKTFDTVVDFNVYNVYNRLNAYYIYIYKNLESPNENILRKVSILPITPSVNISIKF